MNLENSVDGFSGFFNKFKRKVMPYVLAVSLGLAMVGCQEAPRPISVQNTKYYILVAGLGAVVGRQEVPGPISVQNTITPSSVLSGHNIYCEIKVTNRGGKVKIEGVKAHEKAINGWVVGKYDFSADLPITTNEIPAHSTDTIVSSRSFYALNTGDSDITFKNTVTVSSDGGDASDTCKYTILHQ